MDVPSPAAGVVKDVRVKLGDKVSEGSVIATVGNRGGGRGEAGARGRATEIRCTRWRPTPSPQTTPASRAAAPEGARAAAVPRRGEIFGHRRRRMRDARAGAGPGGYSAAFRAADLGMKTVLVERYATLGWRVPERRLHSVEGVAPYRRGDGTRPRRFAEHGITYGAPQIDLASSPAGRTRSSGN